MAKEQDIEKHDKKVIIGQRDDGWWAVNPEPAFIHNDIDKVEILIKAVTSKDQLIKALIDLGYRGDNIFEGILRLE